MVTDAARVPVFDPFPLRRLKWGNAALHVRILEQGDSGLVGLVQPTVPELRSCLNTIDDGQGVPLFVARVLLRRPVFGSRRRTAPSCPNDKDD
jgi:hypothetical protein